MFFSYEAEDDVLCNTSHLQNYFIHRCEKASTSINKVIQNIDALPTNYFGYENFIKYSHKKKKKFFIP